MMRRERIAQDDARVAARDQRRRHFDRFEYPRGGSAVLSLSFRERRRDETRNTTAKERERDREMVGEGLIIHVSLYSPNVLRFWMDIRQTKEIPRMIYNCGAQVLVAEETEYDKRHLNRARTLRRTNRR